MLTPFDPHTSNTRNHHGHNVQVPMHHRSRSNREASVSDVADRVHECRYEIDATIVATDSSSYQQEVS